MYPFSMANAQDAKKTTLSQLEQNYWDLWDSVNKTSEQKFKPNRPLLQLGIPTRNKINLWYYDPVGKAINVNNICVKIANVGNAKCLSEKEYSISTYNIPNYKPLRIEIVFKQLKPGHEYVVKIGNIAIRAMPGIDAKQPSPNHFSLLAWSCNEPLSASHKGILARDLISWNNFGNRASGTLKPSKKSSDIIPAKPSFSLAVGDQIYIDPDATKVDKLGKRKALSFFSGEHSDQIRPDFVAKRDLETVYKYHFGLPPIDYALANIPTSMVWDDHEIKDGWGSHGHELSQSPFDWPSYFLEAKNQFLAFQALRNPNVDGVDWNNSTRNTNYKNISTQFKWGKSVSVFMMDTRSARNYSKGTIVNNDQLERLKSWLSKYDGVEEEQVFILGSPLPMFSSHMKTLDTNAFQRALDKINIYGIADDFKDKWQAPGNKKNYNDVLKIIYQHFSKTKNKNHKLLVVSGDVHFSYLVYLELVMENGKKRVFGHELTSSGISHSPPEMLQNSLSKVAANFRSVCISRNKCITVHPRGGLMGTASFAEVAFKRSKNNKYKTYLVFYPSNVYLTEKSTAFNGKVSSLANSNIRALNLRRYEYDKKIEKNSKYNGTYIELQYDVVPRVRTVWWRRVLGFVTKKKYFVNWIQYLSIDCIVKNSKGDVTTGRDWFNPLPNRKCVKLK